MKIGIMPVFILSIVCAAMLVVACCAATPGGPDRCIFEAGYQTHKQFCEAWLQEHTGAAWLLPGKQRVEMGPSAVPFLIEKMATGEDANYFPREHAACCIITKKRLSA